MNITSKGYEEDSNSEMSISVYLLALGTLLLIPLILVWVCKKQVANKRNSFNKKKDVNSEIELANNTEEESDLEFNQIGYPDESEEIE